MLLYWNEPHMFSPILAKIWAERYNYLLELGNFMAGLFLPIALLFSLSPPFYTMVLIHLLITTIHQHSPSRWAKDVQHAYLVTYQLIILRT